MLKLNILIVENTISDASLIRSLIELDKEGFAGTFTMAYSYEEALEALTTDINFDLLFQSYLIKG